jgi:hypothetical protein
MVSNAPQVRYNCNVTLGRNEGADCDVSPGNCNVTLGRNEGADCDVSQVDGHYRSCLDTHPDIANVDGKFAAVVLMFRSVGGKISHLR